MTILSGCISQQGRDATNKFISEIAFVDYNKNFTSIINHSEGDVIPIGDLGCFDEHGIFPFSPLRYEDKIIAFTCGWSRRISVPVETSTGFAFSEDNGITFKKLGRGAVLTSSIKEPMLVGDSFVRFYGGIFHMWYIYGKYCLNAIGSEPEARVYKIAHATSANGMNWLKEEGDQIIEDILGRDECQALPTVIKIDDRSHMYFCYRYATDFRQNPDRGYRLGYAYSDDLLSWTRADHKKGIEVSESGWDSEMMCYPLIFLRGLGKFTFYIMEICLVNTGLVLRNWKLRRVLIYDWENGCIQDQSCEKRRYISSSDRVQ